MEGRSWYHTIELPDGSTTPGYFDTRPAAAAVEWPAALRGGQCLDVGTFDGFWAFEMEKQGAAEVVALDIDDPDALDWNYDEAETGPAAVRSVGSQRGPGFADLASTLGSSVTRINRSVYDLDPDVDGSFDVVFCGALLLHLREPVRALEAMRSVCRGELVLVETLDPILDLVARRIPSARLHPHWDEWWLVNSAGLVEMVQLAGFEVQWLSKRLLVPFGATGPPPQSRWHSLAALQPTRRGTLHRALRAVPRPRRPSR